jgi:hypothetical protein
LLPCPPLPIEDHTKCLTLGFFSLDFDLHLSNRKSTFILVVKFDHSPSFPFHFTAKTGLVDTESDHRGMLDGHRKNSKVRVIDMFSNQIDASWGNRKVGRGVREVGVEEGDQLVHSDLVM